MALLSQSFQRAHRYFANTETVCLSNLPRLHRVAAGAGLFALVVASTLFIRPLSWQSAAGSEFLFAGQAIDRLVWISLFAALGLGLGAAVIGLLARPWWLTVSGMAIVSIGLLAVTNMTTSAALEILTTSPSSELSVRFVSVLIAGIGAIARLGIVIAFVLSLTGRSLRKRPKLAAAVALITGCVAIMPAVAYVLTLPLHVDEAAIATADATKNAAFLRRETVAMPMAIFAGGSYFVTLLAAVQLREGFDAVVNATSHSVRTLASTRNALRILTALLAGYWMLYLLDALPTSIGRIDSFNVWQPGVWPAAVMTFVVLLALVPLARRDTHLSAAAVLILIVLSSALGIIEFGVFHIVGYAIGDAPAISATDPLIVDFTTVNTATTVVAVVLGLALVARQRSADGALLLTFAVLKLPGVVDRFLHLDLPIPTPIHLAVITTASALIVLFFRWEALQDRTRAAYAVALTTTLALLVLSPAIAKVVDGRLFGIGLVLAYAYRFLFRARDLNEATPSNPGAIPLSLGGAAVLALLGWAVVAFTERFPSGSRAADFWSSQGPLLLASIATPLLIVAVARAMSDEAEAAT